MYCFVLLSQVKDQERELASRDAKLKPLEAKLAKRELEVIAKEAQQKSRWGGEKWIKSVDV